MTENNPALARQIANQLNVTYDTELTNRLVASLRSDMNSDTYLSDVLLLCVECRQPIKARINTQQWIRVEWIGSSGECQACYNRKKDSP